MASPLNSYNQREVSPDARRVSRYDKRSSKPEGDDVEKEARAYLERIRAAARPALRHEGLSGRKEAQPFKNWVNLPDAMKCMVSSYLSPRECAQTVLQVDKAWRNKCLATYDQRQILKELEDLQSYLLENDETVAKELEKFWKFALREFSLRAKAVRTQHFEQTSEYIELFLINFLFKQNYDEKRLEKLIALILQKPNPGPMHRSVVSALNMYKTLKPVSSIENHEDRSRLLCDIVADLLKRGISPRFGLWAVDNLCCNDEGFMFCPKDIVSQIQKDIVVSYLKRGEVDEAHTLAMCIPEYRIYLNAMSAILEYLYRTNLIERAQTIIQGLPRDARNSSQLRDIQAKISQRRIDILQYLKELVPY